MMSKKDVEAGAKQYLEHGHYDNPHELGTSAYDDFERGWVQAQKRWYAPSHSRHGSTTRNDLAGDEGETSEDIHYRAQRYRARKG